MDKNFLGEILSVGRIGFFVYLAGEISIGGDTMGYHYSDPTAARALGDINREFSRLEKKARRLHERLAAGTLSPEALERARSQFTGIYRHVLDLELQRPLGKTEE